MKEKVPADRSLLVLTMARKIRKPGEMFTAACIRAANQID